MSTIGYGDIYAKTPGEMVFMIFSIFIACGLFGYTLNTIGIYSLPFFVNLLQFYFIISIGTILTDLR